MEVGFGGENVEIGGDSAVTAKEKLLIIIPVYQV